MSQAKAAAELGCSRAVMSRWCAGLRSPSRYWWERIKAWSHGAIATDVPRSAFLVMSLKRAGAVQLPSGIEKIPLTWADGMVGVMPVFESREAAERYAQGKYEVVEVTTDASAGH